MERTATVVQVMHRIRRHPGYPRLVRGFLGVVVILLAFQVVRLWHTMDRGAPGTVDFSAYWSAGQLLRRGENPHDFEKLLSIEVGRAYSDPLALGMWNPPWLLVWLFPLFLVDFRTATLIWLGANLAIVLLASTLLWAIFAPHHRQKVALAWITGVVFAPALMTLRQGQVSGLTLLGMVGFLFFITRRQDFVAGAFLALATAKPHTVYLAGILLMWWIIVERRWRVLGGCLSIIALSGLLLATLRPTWIIDYRVALENPPTYWATPTIGGALRGLAGIQNPHVQLLAPAVTGLLTVAYLLRRRPAIVWERTMSPVLLLSVATAAYAWPYDQIVLLIPCVQLITWLYDDASWPRSQKAIVAGGLILHSGVLIGQNLLKVNGVYQFWTPWILGSTYAYAWWHRHQVTTPGGAILAVASTDKAVWPKRWLSSR